MKALFYLLLSLCVACSSTPAAVETPAPSQATPQARAELQNEVLAAPQSINLPDDDGPHNALTEWWYYNGHLQVDVEQRYGFELVIFKRGGQAGRGGYVGHVAVTDHQRKTFQFHEDISVPPPSPQSPGRFNLAVGNMAAQGGGGRDRLTGATADYSIELDLTATKPPVAHGQTGYIGVSPTEASYYYSRTRMSVAGSVRDHGVSVPVTGQAWMDHQWGDFSLSAGPSWDWYSIQLQDGTDLMFSVVRNAAKEVALAYGTLVGPKGETVHIPSHQFKARALDTWTSPVTGIVYPMGWEIETSIGDLRLDPVIPGQEMVTTASVNATYWEGQVTVSGSASGWGYVELTGYLPSPLSALGARPAKQER